MDMKYQRLIGLITTNQSYELWMFYHSYWLSNVKALIVLTDWFIMAVSDVDLPMVCNINNVRKLNFCLL